MAQSPPFPTVVLRGEDVKQVSVFYAPIFTEPVRTNADVRALPDASWLFWSLVSPQDACIPRRGVKLEAAPPLVRGGTAASRGGGGGSQWSLGAGTTGTERLAATLSERALRDMAVGLVRALFATGGDRQLRREEYDRLIDLAVDGDAGLLTLVRTMNDDQQELGYHARRLLQRRLGNVDKSGPAALLADQVAQDVLERQTQRGDEASASEDAASAASASRPQQVAGHGGQRHDRQAREA
eukprot:ctg_2811.g605